MAQRKQTSDQIKAEQLKASTPRGIWAMSQASMAHTPKPKSKIAKTRTRREGKAAARDHDAD